MPLTRVDSAVGVTAVASWAPVNRMVDSGH